MHPMMLSVRQEVFVQFRALVHYGALMPHWLRQRCALNGALLEVATCRLHEPLFDLTIA